MMQARPCKVLAVFASLITLLSSSAEHGRGSTLFASNCASAIEMNDGWTIATPESAGFEPHQLCAIGNAERNGRLRNLHGVVVVRHGHLVFEQYFTGPDWRLGSFLGDVAFHAARHAIRN